MSIGLILVIILIIFLLGGFSGRFGGYGYGFGHGGIGVIGVILIILNRILPPVYEGRLRTKALRAAYGAQAVSTIGPACLAKREPLESVSGT